MLASPTIALFGGTFDPVHDGHLAIAAEARRAAGLDRVIFLPARQSPHKTDRRTLASDDERLRMLQLATAGFPWAEVSDWELHQPPPSYSWKTALHFRAIYPDARLFWLLGADQWEVIADWARPEILRENLDFLVFPRPPLPDPAPRSGWRAHFLETVHPASATRIRAEIAQGDPSPGHLPEALRELAHRIYGGKIPRDNSPCASDAL